MRMNGFDDFFLSSPFSWSLAFQALMSSWSSFFDFFCFIVVSDVRFPQKIHKNHPTIKTNNKTIILRITLDLRNPNISAQTLIFYNQLKILFSFARIYLILKKFKTILWAVVVVNLSKSSLQLNWKNLKINKS